MVQAANPSTDFLATVIASDDAAKHAPRATNLRVMEDRLSARTVGCPTPEGRPA